MSQGQYDGGENPYAQYNFQVEVDGRSVAGFSEVSGISMELETVTYREGGVDDHVHELPDRFAHANLVLRRGLTKDASFWEWIHEVMSGTVSRKNVVVKLTDGFKGQNEWGWEFAGAYPRRWEGPDLTGQNDGMAIETIELVYEKFTTMSGMPK